MAGPAERGGEDAEGGSVGGGGGDGGEEDLRGDAEE